MMVALSVDYTRSEDKRLPIDDALVRASSHLQGRDVKHGLERNINQDFTSTQSGGDHVQP